MDEAPGWTLEELVRRVGLALDGAARVGAYPGAPNGRVRDVPDQRVIRWYTSTGLVDRPIGGRGRGARYGTRHLNQLMAIKRLQAVGSS
ncbi:MAG TPA: MerR family transcriptional regulator, partial [Kineosporiaceae bacterium]|nr:MerR family transcriptional regulator [Kineosporiaceae bacterium]